MTVPDVRLIVVPVILWLDAGWLYLEVVEELVDDALTNGRPAPLDGIGPPLRQLRVALHEPMIKFTPR